MASRLSIPPISDDDRLPHECAVWREGRPHEDAEGHRQVCVDYGGVIERTFVDGADWALVQRWRWGWPPR